MASGIVHILRGETTTLLQRVALAALDDFALLANPSSFLRRETSAVGLLLIAFLAHQAGLATQRGLLGRRPIHDLDLIEFRLVQVELTERTRIHWSFPRTSKTSSPSTLRVEGVYGFGPCGATKFFWEAHDLLRLQPVTRHAKKLLLQDVLALVIRAIVIPCFHSLCGCQVSLQLPKQ